MGRAVGASGRRLRRVKLLVSIHDVMPATLGRVEDIVAMLDAAGLRPATLLVVPGLAWSDRDLDRLRALFAHGAEPAGHGWCHRARRIRGARHRLHSLLISRHAAEHLALSPAGILRLMLRNHRWFGQNELPEPVLYVPPAWAMGPVPRRLLHRLPFVRHETLAGVYLVRQQTLHRLPMAGFETDTVARAAFVAPFNAANAAWSRLTDRPLRLGIHPQDFELKLAGSLQRWIERGGEALSYRALGSDAASTP